MSYEDRDDRLKQVITQCCIRKWVAESPNGGIHGLPTTLAMIAIAILLAIMGVMELIRGNTGSGVLGIAISIFMCTIEIFGRRPTIRAVVRRVKLQQPVDCDISLFGLDIGMIVSPWLSLSLQLCALSLGLYILASAALTASKQPPFGIATPLITSAFALLINVGPKSWHFHRATRRVHSGRCIFCEFTVQSDAPMRTPPDATYSTTRCRDCGHFVPIVVTDTAITENVQA